MRLILIGAVLTAGLLSACSGVSVENGAAAGNGESLEQVPLSLVWENQTLTLTVYVWRDFMPLIDPEHPPGLRATLTVRADSGQALPDGLTVDSTWISSSDQVWAAVVSAEQTGRDSNQLRISLRDGPFWEPGDTVFAVVRLSAGADTAEIRSHPSPIEATY